MMQTLEINKKKNPIIILKEKKNECFKRGRKNDKNYFLSVF